MSVPVRVRRFSRSKVPDHEVVEEQYEAQPEPEAEPEPELAHEPDSDIDVVDDSFLEDLKQDIVEDTPPLPKLKRQRKKAVTPPPSPPLFGNDDDSPSYSPPPSPPKRRIPRRKPVAMADTDFKDLFSQKPSQIIGTEKRQLLTRVKEFKCLFPDELRNFKLKNNPSDDELRQALTEMEAIVSCQGIDTMLTDAILASIQAVEGLTANTKYFDISGTAMALKANPEFYRLCKLIWVKYRVFDKVDPETRLILIVASTAMVCRQTNMKRKELGNLLNTPL